jgi:hypothetical protein
MNIVKVMFNNPKYNYITSVSPVVTQIAAEDYFVGNTFNVGDYPEDIFLGCIGIEYNGKEVITE